MFCSAKQVIEGQDSHRLLICRPAHKKKIHHLSVMAFLLAVQAG
jgi:hypothetical protein